MDKETLSNYGWIIIAAIVISSMLVFISPFTEDYTKNTKSAAVKAAYQENRAGKKVCNLDSNGMDITVSK